MKYSDKLQDPRWQKKRLEIFERDDFTCQHCFTNKNTLHVHHIAYSSGEPWDIENHLLTTLCKECHEIETVDIKTETSLLIKTLKNRGFESLHFVYLISTFENAVINIDSLDYLGFLKELLSNEEKIKILFEKYCNEISNKS